MTQTTNLQLNKPSMDDFYDIAIQNDNMDILDEFCGRKDNPHGVTKTQVGLGNVPNVSTNDQTPTYTVANSNAALTSGEKLSVAFGKIAKAISSLINHLANTSNPHGITASQIGARVNDIKLISGPTTWSAVWALGSGSYTWVQSEKLAWQPSDTPNGALRVILFIDMLPGQSYSARLLYIDGITDGREYIGESDSSGGRWVRVYNTKYKPTAEDVGAVRLGGGVGQNSNNVFIGWDGTGLTLKATVDNTDLGSLLFTGGADQAILPIAKGGTGAKNATTARNNIGAAPLYTYSTTDLTAGTSSLETGKVYIVYE